MAGNVNIGGVFSIAVTTTIGIPDPQDADLDLAEFQALVYIEVPDMGTHGATGVDQSVVTYATWGLLNIQQKGQATGNQVELEFIDADSFGMTALLAAASIAEQSNFAFQIVYTDGRTEFNRGVVTAASFPKGSGEDFRLVTVTLALNQERVIVDV